MIVQDSAAMPGSTGNTFDVILRNDSTMGETVNITGFSVDLKLLTNSSYITFTDINANTSLPYIFSITGSFDGGPSGTVGPSEVTLIDTANTADGQVLGVGQTFGLAHVTYSVAANAPGGKVSVSLVDIGAGTSLTLGPPDYPLFNPLTTDGDIIIQGAIPIPEPSTLTIVAVASSLSLIMSGRLRRRSRQEMEV
jgi:hypothetical protein